MSTRDSMSSLMPPPQGAPGPFDPEGDVLAARLLRFSIARALVFGGAGATVVIVFARQGELSSFGYSLTVTAMVVVLAWLSAFAQAWISRSRFQMVPFALTLLVLDQALFSALAYVTGGVASAATSLLGVTCLVGGMLLGVPGAVVAGFAGGVFFSLNLLIVQAAPALLPPDQPNSFYDLSSAQAAYYYVFTILMLVLVSLLSSLLADRLVRTGGALQDARRRARQAERMAELGRLAAGLAHEIRNPLGSISGAVQVLKVSAEREEDRDLCDIVLRESARLDELVSDMVNLSKPRPPTRVLVDLGSVVKDVVELASSSGRGGQDVQVVQLGVRRAIVSADPGHLRQLVWNLVRNAVQASGAGGQVRVRLDSVETVTLSVEDDGVGIDSGTRDQLFDAFFTTRTQGTGVGLAVVKRIVDEHGFAISVHSEHGEGAQFLVDLGPERALDSA